MLFALRFALLMSSLSLALGGGPIRVTDDFESGSLGEWRLEADTKLVFVPRKEVDQDGVNSAVTWFYGRLENVLHREVTIEISGLDYTVYNGTVGDILPFERNTVPVYSYDGEHWERFSNCAFNKEARTFTIRQVFSRDSVWIAYIPPYPFSRLQSQLKALEGKPGVHLASIGRSVQGKPLHLVTLSPMASDEGDLPVAWIVARQHSFETGGSWAIEGLLQFLTSSDPEALKIRQRTIFKICPMLNPDGVTAGGTRFNAKGVDLNRHWSPDDPLSSEPFSAPEIALVKQAVHRWRETHRLDLWVNIHNNDMVWNEDGDYIRFAPEQAEPRARRLEKALREHTIFSGPFFASKDPLATESVVAAETGALSLLLEMKTGYLDDLQRWTGTDLFLAFGRDLARAVDAFLLEENK